MALGEQCLERCLWGTRRNPRVFSLTHACGALRGRTIRSLAARGNFMESSFKNIKITEDTPMEASSEDSGRVVETGSGAERASGGTRSTGTAAADGKAGSSADRAPGGTGSTDTAKEDAAKGEDLAKKKLSGAAKRRRARERKGEDQARAQARDGLPPAIPGTSSSASPRTPDEGAPGNSGSKRRRGPNETPQSAEEAKKKRRVQGTLAYASAADPLTRVVVAEGYPEAVLSAEQVVQLRGAVFKEIQGIREGTLPRFDSTSPRAGAAVVRCADAESLRWLESRIGDIVPWEGARLRVVGLESLQKQVRAAVWVPGPPEPAAAVLGLLERQNPGITTSGWRVHAENVGATCEGRNLILGIPESSVLKLKALDFRPYLGMDRVTFRVTGTSQDGKKGGGGEPDPKASSS